MEKKSDDLGAKPATKASGDATMAGIAPSPTPETTPHDDAAVAALKLEARRIVKSYMTWSVAAGLVPVPVLDLAAISAVQTKMIEALAKHYSVAFNKEIVQSIIGTALGVGGTAFVAAPAGSLLKLVPVVGTLLGLVVEPAVAASATYILGETFIKHFEVGGTIFDIDLTQKVKEAVKDGKENIASLRRDIKETAAA